MADSRTAFISYSRADDANDGNFISDLRDRLETEVQSQTGEPFRIFQDTKDILLGNNWKKALHDALDEVVFLMPVMTPNFFGSESCREEVKYFSEREKRLGRDDLILPIYWIDSSIVCRDDRQRKNPEAAELYEFLMARQNLDWCEVRERTDRAGEVRNKIIALAGAIKQRLDDPDLLTSVLADRAAGPPERDPGSTPASGDATEHQSSPATTGPGPRLRLVRTRNDPDPSETRLVTALSQLDLTPADSSFIAVQTMRVRDLLRPDNAQPGMRDERVRSVRDELSRHLNSIAMGGRTAAENARACRTANRLRLLLISLLTETSE
jgi:hypothetical protein